MEKLNQNQHLILESCQIITSRQCAPSPTYAHFENPTTKTIPTNREVDEIPTVGKALASGVVMIEEKSLDPFDVSQQKIVTTSLDNEGSFA